MRLGTTARQKIVSGAADTQHVYFTNELDINADREEKTLNHYPRCNMDMDYLKVPDYPKGWSNKLDTDPLHWFELKRSTTTLIDDEWRWLANLINAVYTPTTGLLAQLEDQKREIEELRGKVNRNSEQLELAR